MNEDFHLFKDMKKGNANAFEKLFRKYYNPLANYALNILRDGVMAEEIAQNVFVQLWEKRESIEIKTAVKAYLYTSIRNKCLNFIRLELPKIHASVSLEDATLLVTDEINLDEANNEALQKIIQQAVEKLPKKCKKIFLLSKFSGLTYQEIAEELNISTKTVEGQMSIALRKLRQSLKPIYERIKK